jgi:threonine dehydrogenase-like Zn-dependent dehydrogenase
MWPALACAAPTWSSSPARWPTCTTATPRIPCASGTNGVWTADDLPNLAFDAVIGASNAAALPALALDLVEPGKRVVYIGLAGTPSTIDTRAMALKDVTAIGILSGSPGLAGAIEAYALDSVDPRSLVAATVSLGHVGDVLAGSRADAGAGPKIHVDPGL